MTYSLRNGADLVDVARTQRMIEKGGDEFVDSIWSAHEQAYAAGRMDRFSSRWAAKEATLKALGVGIGTVDLIDVEVRSVEGEPPVLHLTGKAAALAAELRVKSWALTLSHETGVALAHVVALLEGPDD